MRIENLKKSYKDAIVFEHFNLEIEDGKVTCILGGSGAGKTTLLNVIAGLTSYEGAVDKVRCSYIFQEPRLVPNLTVRKNLKLICNDDEKINAVLARVGLAEKAESYPVALSGGQAQRVAIARAFLYESDVVLMDEPFSSLDLKLKKDMMQAFCEVRSASGRTAVFVTHDADEALFLADRIIVISDGKIIFDKPNNALASFGGNSPLREELIAALTA